MCSVMPESSPLTRGEESLVPKRVDYDGLWDAVGFLEFPGCCQVQSHPRASFSSLSQVFTKYGKCYMFNSGEDGKPLLTTVKGGTGNGLEIMLDIQQDEYRPIWGETGEPGQGPGQGVREEGCSLRETFAWSRLSWPTR